MLFDGYISQVSLFLLVRIILFAICQYFFYLFMSFFALFPCFSYSVLVFMWGRLHGLLLPCICPWLTPCVYILYCSCSRLWKYRRFHSLCSLGSLLDTCVMVSEPNLQLFHLWFVFFFRSNIHLCHGFSRFCTSQFLVWQVRYQLYFEPAFPSSLQ